METLRAIGEPTRGSHGRRPILKLATEDGRRFICKGTQSPKERVSASPIWLSNEAAYRAVASQLDVEMPDSAWVVHEHVTYFGSEYREGREKLDDPQQIQDALRANPGNRMRLVRAVVADVALLNSDRAVQNILLNEPDGTLWFYDHDKSLWGDGRERDVDPPGDLWRLTLGLLERPEEHVERLISDYLGAGPIARIALDAQGWQLLRRQFAALDGATDQLAHARQEVPAGWVTDDLWNRLIQFLPEWWRRIREYFDKPSTGPEALLCRVDARERASRAR